MTPKAKTCIDLVLKHEGGLVDNRRDPGGLTNYGIALKRHPELTRADILGMTPDRAAGIYESAYWHPIRGDDLPLPLAMVTLDAGVMSGISRASQWLQKALGVSIDGVIGPATIHAAVNCAYLRTAVRDTCAARMDFLQRLDTWDVFGDGWRARVMNTQTAALAAIGA